MVIKSLGYQDDINFDEPVDMLDGKYKWEPVKRRLVEITIHPARLFDKI
ncbi:MAG: hypothetical protein ACTHMM_10945 [Agriterribacter sp.]